MDLVILILTEQNHMLLAKLYLCIYGKGVLGVQFPKPLTQDLKKKQKTCQVQIVSRSHPLLEYTTFFQLVKNLKLVC